MTVVMLTGCGNEVAGGSDAEPAGSWEQLPDAPLSPRENAVTVTVDDHVLVVGGSDAPPCPPGADCATPGERSLTDGAVFDPATAQWRSTTDAPVPIERAHSAVLGSVVYLWVPDTGRPDSRNAFVSYDLETDEWTELPLPPNAESIFCCDIAATEDRLVAYPGSDEQAESPDHIFDPATGEWTELPADPLSPTYDRVMVWTGTELIHFGSPTQESPEHADGWFGLAAALDLDSGEWRRLPDTGGHIVDTLMIGGRIVNPWLGSSGGDPDDGDLYGWTYDVRSGEVSGLPDAPSVPGVSSTGVIADGEGYFVEDHGWVLDLDTEEWAWIEPRPGSDRDDDGPHISGVSTAAVGESMFAYGGVRWAEMEGSDPEWLDEAWLWTP